MADAHVFLYGGGGFVAHRLMDPRRQPPTDLDGGRADNPKYFDKETYIGSGRNVFKECIGYCMVTLIIRQKFMLKA